MVLQQNEEITIWGWGKPQEKVTLKASWAAEEYKTEVNNQAHWAVKIRTPKAGGPHELIIMGYNSISLKDILIGEVWLCSGQSNMEWSANMKIDNAEKEIEDAHYPNIRFFSVHNRTALQPQIDLGGDGWAACSPETMKHFSAVAYFFARKLQKELEVPVGLINASWGGTPIEVWMPGQVVEEDAFLKAAAEQLIDVPWGPIDPGKAYNAMIAPLVNFNIAGAIWYQGESNTRNPFAYKEMLTALTGAWRRLWKKDFPFYFVQIAPYQYDSPLIGAIVRDEQRQALEIPNTGMAVTSDIGNISDIHPGNKQDVGLRLANLALKHHYQTINSIVSGPLYRSMNFEENKIRLYFDYAEGLHFKGKSDTTFFEIAGKDRIFYPAKAEISENTILVSSRKVNKPLAVRFAWSNTAEPDLFNSAGLPASCFRTDNWEIKLNQK